LQNRHFLVKSEDEYTEPFLSHVGVLQSSVIGQLLYLLFTTDLQTSSETTSATFADDTTVLAVDNNTDAASSKLQSNLPAIKIGSENGELKRTNLNQLASHSPQTLSVKDSANHIGRSWYVLKETIRKDLQIPMVKEEISCHSTQYSKRLSTHLNGITVNLEEPPRKRRLQRHLPIDLPTKFNMQS
jgi:hypothetical protein